MTTWFVTRHPGAIEWAARQGLTVDRRIAHLDPDMVASGDTVIGILPVHLAARVCARGARYFNLSIDIPENARGQELSADELTHYGASIEAYEVRAVRPKLRLHRRDDTEATRTNALQPGTDLSA